MELKGHYSDFRQLGAELDTISVDAPAVSKGLVDSERFVDKEGVQFPVLSDLSHETIKAYGVLSIARIATPSAFIIDKSGIIRWKFIGDTTTRANIDIMLQQLETLNLETPKSFNLVVPAGTSMVHLPRLDTEVNGESRSITKVSDLFVALGGESNVHWLITTPAPTRGGTAQFQVFFEPSDADISANAAIQPYTGILVSLRNAMSIDLAGDPVEGAIRLFPGPNLVGVPHTDAGINRVSDFAKYPVFLDKISLISMYVNGTFHPILPNDIAPGALNDLEISSGQAFIVVAKQNWFQQF